jgi:uncharacterized membrane protein
MKLSVLIASAVATVIAAPVLAESGSNQSIDEKCYGVSPRDVSVCGTDSSSCAYMADTRAETGGSATGNETSGNRAQAAKGGDDDIWAFVPKGTCVKIYGGSLSAKSS